MVLFLFVLMLLNLNKESEPMRSGVVKVMGAVAGMCLLVVILGSLRIIEIDNGDVVAQPSIGLVKQLGEVLFDKFLLPFEISSILLLTAMVGAVLLAKKDTKKVNG